MKQDDTGDHHTDFVLAHVGRFDRWRSSEAWFTALSQFVRALGADRDRFTLRIVGHVNAQVRKKLCATGARCAFVGYTSHQGAIQEMRSADGLLLSVPEGRNADAVIPAKLFEYLAAGRPILVVGPQDGECEAIVRSLEAGLTVGFAPDAITDALEPLFSAWRAGRPMPGCKRDRIACYSRRHLSERLAAVFDSLLDRRTETCEAVPALTEVYD